MPSYPKGERSGIVFAPIGETILLVSGIDTGEWAWHLLAR
jgi:hypothetical protein